MDGLTKGQTHYFSPLQLTSGDKYVFMEKYGKLFLNTLSGALFKIEKISACIGDLTRLRGYRIFFMLNSTEHEILNAHRYKHIKKFSLFLGSDNPGMLFFPLIKG